MVKGKNYTTDLIVKLLESHVSIMNKKKKKRSHIDFKFMEGEMKTTIEFYFSDGLKNNAFLDSYGTIEVISMSNIHAEITRYLNNYAVEKIEDLITFIF